MMSRNFVLSSLAVALMLLAFGYGYTQSQRPSTPSLAERCTELGGEWLYNSHEKICTMPDGEWLAYSLSKDAFVPQSELELGLPEVLAASDEVAASDSVRSCDEPLEFSAYPVAEEEVFSGLPAVDFLTNDAARYYHTAISKDVSRGANFAGKYVVSTWGCGSGCVGSAVVNAESGKILNYGLTSTGYDFSVDSRLLDAHNEGYYVVEDDVLKQVCK
jgi:hypothetical protein